MRKNNDTVKITAQDLDKMFDYLADAYNHTIFTTQSYFDSKNDRICLVQRICKGCTKTIYDSCTRATARDMAEELLDEEHLLFKLDMYLPAFIAKLEDVVKEKKDGKIIVIRPEESYFIKPFGKGFTVHPIEEDTLEVYYEFEDVDTMLFISTFFTLFFAFPIFQDTIEREFNEGKLTEKDIPRIQEELRDHAIAIVQLSKDADKYFDRKYDTADKDYENLNRNIGMLHNNEVELTDDKIDELFLSLQKDFD